MKSSSPAVKKFPVEQFFAIRSISGFALSHNDKTIYYISNTTGIPQIWSVPIEGGWSDQITLWNDSVRGVYHNPVIREIIFSSDTKGNEQIQLYRISGENAEPEHLTAGFEDSQNFFIGYNKKGTKIIFSSNKRLKYNFDTFIRDLKTGENKLVRSFEDQFPTHAVAWSRDENYIVFNRFFSNSGQELLLFNTKTEEMINVTESGSSKDVLNTSAEFNKESTGFYYITDEGREFKGIKFYDIKKKKSEWFIKEDWDVTGYTFTKDRKKIAWSVKKYGNNAPKMMHTESGKKIKMNLSKGNYLSMEFSGDGSKLVYIVDSPLTPSDIFEYDIKKNKTRQVTNSLVGGINKNAFTSAKDVFYESFDKTKIHALFYVPKGIEKNGKNSAIVWPHGGPEHAESHNFNRYIQVMCNAGYVVIAPNFRGSTGYGKSFQKKIYGDWGGAEFKDVLGSVDFLKKSGYIDSGKIAVVGGSFGGFMTLTCITKAPEIWKCAVDIFGPSNLFTFLDSIPEHWKPGAYSLVGNPEKDREMLADRSPINYIENIKCPLLVIQGRHDPRVVVEESDQIVKKLKEMNKTVEYILLEDEGHGFSKVSNQIMVFKAKLEFLNKYLSNNLN